MQACLVQTVTSDPSAFLSPHLVRLPPTSLRSLLGADVKATLSAGSSHTCISVAAPIIGPACLGPTAAWTSPLGLPAGSPNLIC